MSLVLRESVLKYADAEFDSKGNIIALKEAQGAGSGSIFYSQCGIDLPGRVVMMSAIYYRDRSNDRVHAIGVWGRDHTGKWYKVTTDVPNAVAKEITAALQERVEYTMGGLRVKLPRSEEDRNVERLADLCGMRGGLWLWDEKFNYERYHIDGEIFDPYNNGVHQWKLIKCAKITVSYRGSDIVLRKEGVDDSVTLNNYAALNVNRQLANYIVKYCLKD